MISCFNIHLKLFLFRMEPPIILTLQVAPGNPVTEEIVRKTGANPKNIMRLLNHEPVNKLYEYLQSKWKLSNFKLTLLCKGKTMDLASSLSSYSDGLSGKLPIEYELVPGHGDTEIEKKTHGDSSDISQSSTAAPTPRAVTPAPQESFEVHEPQEALIVHERARKSHRQDHSPKKPSVKKSNVQSTNEALISTVPPVGTLTVAPIERVANTVHSDTDNSKVEALYREMLDRERDIFTNVLESQAKWMADMQTRMINFCVSISNGGNMSESDHIDESELKNSRKQK